jgi:signal transduction histidine kinase
LSAAQEDDRGVISVRDPGRGIALDVLPAHLRAVLPGRGVAQRRQHGLRLAIAKELIEAQDGAISVESQPGQGRCSP